MSDSYIIAYIAGSICFITSLPQLYQIITTKKVRDLNPYFFALHSTSDVLYIVYGVLVDDLFLATSISLSAFCNFLILILWFAYKNND